MENYLDDAISKYKLTNTDITGNYQTFLEKSASLELQISIAQSLAKIADELEKLRLAIEVENDQNFKDKFCGG
jgi:hypothetical protein